VVLVVCPLLEEVVALVEGQMPPFSEGMELLAEEVGVEEPLDLLQQLQLLEVVAVQEDMLKFIYLIPPDLILLLLVREVHRV
jgi:hypothetical protein